MNAGSIFKEQVLSVSLSPAAESALERAFLESQRFVPGTCRGSRKRFAAWLLERAAEAYASAPMETRERFWRFLLVSAERRDLRDEMMLRTKFGRLTALVSAFRRRMPTQQFVSANEDWELECESEPAAPQNIEPFPGIPSSDHSNGDHQKPE